MLFGHCNAPATFERLMEIVLADFIWYICLVYLNDVIVCGKSFEGELGHLRKMFFHLHRAWLLINPKKRNFLCHKVKYAKHVASCSFLGFCTYYRKIVRNFFSNAKLLYQLTEDRINF
jgi:hypothetical protein